MKIQDVDFSLYVITDADASGGRMHQEVVRLAVEGGARAILYRDKTATLRRQWEVGRQLREITRRHGAALVVNDRPDLAVSLGADAVNIGPEDLPAEAVRKVVGRNVLVGVSVSSEDEAREAVEEGADFLVARPVFPTRWKSDGRPIMGSEGLTRIVRAVGVPVIAVGGVNMSNLGSVLEAGAAGVGVVAEIIGAQDPRAAAQEYRQALDSYRKSAEQV